MRWVGIGTQPWNKNRIQGGNGREASMPGNSINKRKGGNTRPATRRGISPAWLSGMQKAWNRKCDWRDEARAWFLDQLYLVLKLAYLGFTNNKPITGYLQGQKKPYFLLKSENCFIIHYLKHSQSRIAEMSYQTTKCYKKISFSKGLESQCYADVFAKHFLKQNYFPGLWSHYCQSLL